LAGPEFPIFELSVRNYVVFLSPDKLNQPATSRGHEKESPKLAMRQKRMELAMTWNSKEWRLRRIHSTTHFIGKEFSYVRPDKLVPLGIFESSQLSELKFNIVGNLKCNNLSIIMSDPNFLIAAWIKIRSNSKNLSSSFNNGTLDGIKLSWFEKTANTMRNGVFKFSPVRKTYVSKPDGKKRTLTVPSPKDKIVQEAMRFLLMLIFEKDFSQDFYGGVSGKSCHSALNQIKLQFSQDNWYIGGDIKFPALNRQIIVELLKTKIEDQAFIDLIYKYLKICYGEKSDIKTISKGGILSPMLASIYIIPFDNWVNSYLKPKYTKGKKKQANPAYTKMTRTGKVIDHSTRSCISHDKNFIRLHYVRYADVFLMGLNGPKKFCKQIILECKTFLLEKLKLTLNEENTKITHGEQESALFLGHRVHKTELKSMKVAYNSQKKLTRRVTNTILDGPVDLIVEKLIKQGYAKKNGAPTRNGKFVNYTLFDLVDHFQTVERGILQFFNLANNYGRIAARVHYILKYSCALTIASKMKLKTLRRVFNKYGKNLNIKDQTKTTIISYPTINYKRPKTFVQTPMLDFSSLEKSLDKYDNRLRRGRQDLKGLCLLCGSQEKIEIHHVHKLSKSLKRKDYLSKVMARMNRKQIPVCKNCHTKIHKGIYDGKQIK
jgi:retron-type reverse transcriptase